MYGLPKDIDLSFLIGREVEFIGLVIGNVRVGFDEKVQISIETSFTFNKKLLEIKDGHLLHVLLGKKIIAAVHGKGEGDLQLDFEDGYRLILHDDSKQYQAYNIFSPKRAIVV